jgi:hypothetical protein
MAACTKHELRKVAKTDDLHIAPFRDDGVTCGTPTWIWSVAVGDALYVRACNGTASSWYQAALRQKAGRVTAAGMTKELAFEPISGSINKSPPTQLPCGSSELGLDCRITILDHFPGAPSAGRCEG